MSEAKVCEVYETKDVRGKQFFQTKISKVVQQIVALITITALATPAAAQSVVGHYGKLRIYSNSVQITSWAKGNSTTPLT